MAEGHGDWCRHALYKNAGRTATASRARWMALVGVERTKARAEVTAARRVHNMLFEVVDVIMDVADDNVALTALRNIAAWRKLAAASSTDDDGGQPPFFGTLDILWAHSGWHHLQGGDAARTALLALLSDAELALDRRLCSALAPHQPLQYRTEALWLLASLGTMGQLRHKLENEGGGSPVVAQQLNDLADWLVPVMAAIAPGIAVLLPAENNSGDSAAYIDAVAHVATCVCWVWRDGPNYAASLHAFLASLAILGEQLVTTMAALAADGDDPRRAVLVLIAESLAVAVHEGAVPVEFARVPVQILMYFGQTLHALYTSQGGDIGDDGAVMTHALGMCVEALVKVSTTTTVSSHNNTSEIFHTVRQLVGDDMVLLQTVNLALTEYLTHVRASDALNDTLHAIITLVADAGARLLDDDLMVEGLETAAQHLLALGLRHAQALVDAVYACVKQGAHVPNVLAIIVDIEKQITGN
jgi:hypothetical protein